MIIKRTLRNSIPERLKATMGFLIASFLQRGILVITTPVFTRLLSTSEYGHYQVFNSWLSIISVIITLNLFYGVYLQGLVKFENDRFRYASSLQGLCLTLCLFWTSIYFIFENFWDKIFCLSREQMVLMFVIIWSSSAFSFWAQEQRTDNKYKTLIILTLIVSFFEPFVEILLVIHMKEKVTARILGMAIVDLSCYGWCFIKQLISGKCFFDKKYWKYSLAFNVALLPHYLSSVVLNSADRIMISKMVGASEAGIYSLAYSASLMMSLFNNALLQTTEPWIYKKIKNNELKKIENVAYISFWGIAIINVLFIAFAPEIIGIFAPKEYYEGIYIVPPVAMSNFFTFIYSFFACFEFYYEKKQYIAVSSVAGAILNVFLNYIFIRLFGYIAAAYTTLICFILYAVLHYHFMRKIVNDYLQEKIYNTKAIICIAGGMIVSGFAFLLTYKTDMIRYCIISFLFAVIIIKRKRITSTIQEILNLSTL